MSDSSSSGASVDTTPAPKRPFDATRFLIFAGLALLYMTCAAFLLICFRLYRSGYAGDLQSYIPEMILFVVGSLSAFFGVGLLRTVGLATIEPKAVINPKEWEDIRDKVKDGNEDTVTQYVRLSSLIYWVLYQARITRLAAGYDWPYYIFLSLVYGGKGLSGFS